MSSCMKDKPQLSSRLPHLCNGRTYAPSKHQHHNDAIHNPTVVYTLIFCHSAHRVVARDTMWLINTATLHLKHFIFNDEIPFYTVLSHTWGDEELTFQDWNIITKQPDSVEASRLRSRQGYLKIENFCRLSKSSQFCPHWATCTYIECNYYMRRALAGDFDWATTECCVLSNSPQDHCKRARSGPCVCGGRLGSIWAWADTVCIDKSSSTELQEHLIAMYRIYAKACLCLTFLSDVTEDEGENLFPHSRWFTRGWTLQELIASRRMIFFSHGWSVIGDRASLALAIERSTLIPQNVLQFGLSHYIDPEESLYYTGNGYDGTGGVFDASNAQIFSWVARRTTSRDEDIVYSLLGLLDVQSPLMYGEGSKNAFRRLQEELLLRDNDFSLFAWTKKNRTSIGRACLFASHPSLFAGCGNVIKVCSGADPVSKFLRSMLQHPAQLSTRLATLRLLTFAARDIHIPAVTKGGPSFKIKEIRTAVLNCYRIGRKDQLMTIRICEQTPGVFMRMAADSIFMEESERIKRIIRWRKVMRREILEDTTLKTYGYGLPIETPRWLSYNLDT